MVSGDQRTPSRRYRRSDGSIRTESGPSFDFVDILSIPRQRFFVFAPGAGWREHPMRPQLAPMQLSRARALPVARNDARVAAVASLGTEFEFYEVTGASITQIFCPQLNMMSVWLKDATGRVIETTRVTIGEPATSFEPPPGVAIEQRAEPEGPGRVEGALRRQVVR